MTLNTANFAGESRSQKKRNAQSAKEVKNLLKRMKNQKGGHHEEWIG